MRLIHEHSADVGPIGERIDARVITGVDPDGVTFALILQDSLYDLERFVEGFESVQGDDRRQLLTRVRRFRPNLIFFDE